MVSLLLLKIACDMPQSQAAQRVSSPSAFRSPRFTREDNTILYRFTVTSLIVHREELHKQQTNPLPDYQKRTKQTASLIQIAAKSLKYVVENRAICPAPQQNRLFQTSSSFG